MVSLLRVGNVLGTKSIESIKILDVVDVSMTQDGSIDGSLLDGSSQFVCVVCVATSGESSTVVSHSWPAICRLSRILPRSAVAVWAWAARAAEYMSRCWYRQCRKRSANSETIRSMSGSTDMRVT